MGLMVTEQSNPRSAKIDRMSTLQMLTVINEEDHTIADCVQKVLPAIGEAVDLIYEKLRGGGRLVYVGAGTSGRLGVLDASECKPTYNSDQVIGLIAGGEEAMFHAREGAEDSPELAVKQLQQIGFCSRDVLVGIAASGRTPFVLGAAEYAHKVGTRAIGIANNPDSELGRIADIIIEAVTGPEVVTGSTRMKAGTCDKMILNMISTCVMIKLGKVYGNLMVDVQVSNEKLSDRAVRIVSQISGASFNKAREVLSLCRDVKTAIVMIRLGKTQQEARSLLEDAGGNLSKVPGLTD